MSSPATTISPAALSVRAAPIVSELGVPHCLKQCPEVSNTLLGTQCDDWCFCSKYAYQTAFWKGLENCVNSSCKDSAQHTIAMRFVQSQGEAIQANCEFRGLKDASAHNGLGITSTTTTSSTTHIGLQPTGNAANLWSPTIPTHYTKPKHSAAPATRPSGGFLFKVVGSLVIGLVVAGALPSL